MTILSITEEDQGQEEIFDGGSMRVRIQKFSPDLSYRSTCNINSWKKDEEPLQNLKIEKI